MYYCKDIKLLIYSLQGCGIIMMRDIYTVTPTLFGLTRNALTPISCLALTYRAGAWHVERPFSLSIARSCLYFSFYCCADEDSLKVKVVLISKLQCATLISTAREASFHYNLLLLQKTVVLEQMTDAPIRMMATALLKFV